MDMIFPTAGGDMVVSLDEYAGIDEHGGGTQVHTTAGDFFSTMPYRDALEAVYVAANADAEAYDVGRRAARIAALKKGGAGPHTYNLKKSAKRRASRVVRRMGKTMMTPYPDDYDAEDAYGRRMMQEEDAYGRMMMRERDRRMMMEDGWTPSEKIRIQNEIGYLRNAARAATGRRKKSLERMLG